VNALFALPSQSVTGGRLAELPAPTTRIPRQQPLPKPKPLTKWQKFAQQKGITKRKRSKLAFDETSQTWKRRHGYGKANDEAAVPIIEARASDKVSKHSMEEG
jgi:regulator of ribosome biosynthesis